MSDRKRKKHLFIFLANGSSLIQTQTFFHYSKKNKDDMYFFSVGLPATKVIYLVQ